MRPTPNRLHWFASGDGPPWILLHGFTGAASSWSAVAERLPGPVAGLHLPGHHPDAPVPADFRAGVAWIIEALADAGVERARLVGYSLGARAALGVSAEHPAWVESVDLIGVRTGLTTEAERALRRRADRRWIELLTDHGIEAFVDAWEALPLWTSQRRVSAARLAEQRLVRCSHDPAGLAGSLATMGLAEMPDYGETLGELAAPTRLIVGALDERFLATTTRLSQRHQIELIVIPEAGHNVVLEAPDALALALAG